MELTTLNNDPVMSTREIAELTGKQHGHVMRDTKKMLESLEIEQTPFLDSDNSGANGKKIEFFRLPKDLTITLVSGYNVKMRHAITTRWMELEAKTNSEPAWMQHLSQEAKVALEDLGNQLTVTKQELVQSNEALEVEKELSTKKSFNNQRHTVTELAKHVQNDWFSNVACNKILIEAGYQYKLLRNYQLTEEGKRYGVEVRSGSLEYIHWTIDVLHDPHFQAVARQWHKDHQ